MQMNLQLKSVVKYAGDICRRNMQMNLQMKSVVEIYRLNLQLKSYMKWMGPGFVPVPCCLRAHGGQVLYA